MKYAAAMFPPKTWVRCHDGRVVQLTSQVEGGMIFARDKNGDGDAVKLTEPVERCAEPYPTKINKTNTRNRKPK